MGEGDTSKTSDADEKGDKGAAGLEHLQAAARELIAAFRTVLDAAEELVEDPDTVKQTFSAFGTVARDVARQAAGFAAGAAGAAGNGGGGADQDAGVEHIDLDDAAPDDTGAES